MSECPEVPIPDKPTRYIEGKGDCIAPDHSHDSFDSSKHKNWLLNSAGLGIYAHGRVHQEGDRAIFVGDLIHKRGYLATDDLLKMEEQSLESMGDPLVTNSKMGRLLALVLLPAMNTANGEGVLIGYYDGGVVSYDTFKAPRETRHDGEGVVLQKGWDTQRLVNHLLNTVSAVAQNAVALLPRDHFFRSFYGLHFLTITLGDGSFKPENTNLLSQGVQPLLDMDASAELEGAACGCWTRGHRLLATFGFIRDESMAVLPMARGMVSLNQATTFTEDRTPRATWEGAWVPDHYVRGIHKFETVGVRPTEHSFGFIASDRDKELYFASVEPNLKRDIRDDVEIPIEWDFETRQISAPSTNQLLKLSEGFLEGKFDDSSHGVRVFVRSDRHTEWVLWKEFNPCDHALEPGEQLQRHEHLGQPTADAREATWFQFRVEGVGFAEIQNFFADISTTSTKAGRSHCVAVGSNPVNPLKFNSQPIETRWPKL